jgi:hypothetical protein
MQVKNRLLGAISLLAATLIIGCASTANAPAKAKITTEVSVEATVITFSKATREILLERADGARVIVVAGPEVRNFNQIAAGDILNARYTVSIAARILASDEPDTEPTVGLTAARAELGDKPAGAIGAGVQMTVVVNSVDSKRHIVVFTGPDGVVQVVEAQYDEGKKFVKGLKSGDRVELVYGQSVMLEIK